LPGEQGRKNRNESTHRVTVSFRSRVWEQCQPSKQPAEQELRIAVGLSPVRK
jgi:hypothetical protein